VPQRDADEPGVRHPRRHRARSAGGTRHVEQREQPFRSGAALHARVVIGAERAQRREELGGEQQHQQRQFERQLALVALFATRYRTGRAVQRNLRRADHQQINRIRRTWRAAFIDPQQG
jgi:hypothetical protein